VTGQKLLKIFTVVASNSEEIFKQNIQASDVLKNKEGLIVLKNPLSASCAYNNGMGKNGNGIFIFVHQDVFLPPGWFKEFKYHINRLSELDPSWGVVGLYGVKASGEGAGFVYSTGLGRFVGQPFKSPIQVRSLDELLLVVRKSSGLRFDERLPGFHLYGTDICLEAEKRGMRNYVIPCFALHNSVGVRWLPWSFWRGYLYLRKKWQDRLPVITPCTTITTCCGPVIESMWKTVWLSIRKKNNRGTRERDPKIFYNEYLASKVEGKTVNVLGNLLR
jgi:hypothetical protein